MIHTWFECKIRYEKTMENGMNKKVTEPYLVDALSFTEAESRIIEEMQPFITGEFHVTAIKLVNYKEYFPSDDEVANKWYKVKANFITLDEKSGKEKRIAWYAIVQSDSTVNAEKYFHERMKGTLADYTVESVSETPIVDVFPFVLEKETEETK